ncbi:MAG: hypothetical protein ACRD29_04035 [Acidimicrobiales bacterium]
MTNVDEGRRHRLHLALEEHLGTEKPETMMTLLPPVGWADVATKHDLRQLKDAVKGDVLGVKYDVLLVKDDLRQLKDAVKAEVLGVKDDIAALESRMERFEVALRDQTRTYVTWMLMAQGTTVTLVIAALALFR